MYIYIDHYRYKPLTVDCAGALSRRANSSVQRGSSSPTSAACSKRVRVNPNLFYSDLAYFVKTCILNVYEFLSNKGLTRRNALFILLWLRPTNT